MEQRTAHRTAATAAARHHHRQSGKGHDMQTADRPQTHEITAEERHSAAPLPFPSGRASNAETTRTCAAAAILERHNA
jgi:hypothetical protein